MNDENSESLREVVSKSQEKLRNLQKKIKELEEKHIELETTCKIIENKSDDDLLEKIHALDIRLQAIEIAQGGYNENWKQIVNFVFQLIWVVMSAYILLKLGLQPI
jgi:predicted  nucleic acid-binding Zn-ribbon protein